MKTDSSLILYNTYYKLKNRIIEIELKNHIQLTGKFIGFCRSNKTFISKWHLVDANLLFGIDAFGFLVGQIINHKDIVKIKFTENNSTMKF